MSDRPPVLVTGGAGFVGSHVCVALIEAGFEPVVLDNLGHGDARALEGVAAITGSKPRLVVGDMRDAACVAALAGHTRFVAVLHLAGLKSVAASMADPAGFTAHNVEGARTLLGALHAAPGMRAFVFSSSATVYGAPAASPVAESAALRPANPYGESKREIERLVTAFQRDRDELGVMLLRYFNPVGAHESGWIGEAPRGVPSNLMPLVARVAAGLQERLVVHGGDWPTPDGSGVRDYVHVMDVAQAHVAALKHALLHPGVRALNLGVGQGVSVLELVRAFEQASGCHVPFTIGPRRAGDVAAYWADPALAYEVLGWQAWRDLRAMCADAWRWQQRLVAGG